MLNYETNEAKLLQLVLLGQMELLPLLTSMPNLMDRISLKCTLEPLDAGETRQLIHFRLTEAGYRSPMPLFTDEAVTAIYDATEGYPRRVAMLCHRALRALVMHKGRVVDDALIDTLIHQDQEAGWPPLRRLQKSVSSV